VGAGVEGVDVHTLRHSAAVTWLESRVHIKAVADITGDIYGHTSDDTARAAVVSPNRGTQPSSRAPAIRPIGTDARLSDSCGAGQKIVSQPQTPPPKEHPDEKAHVSLAKDGRVLSRRIPGRRTTGSFKGAVWPARAGSTRPHGARHRRGRPSDRRQPMIVPTVVEIY
jgi:hypothetical protein